MISRAKRAVQNMSVAISSTWSSTETKLSPTFVTPSLSPKATPRGPMFLALRRSSARVGRARAPVAAECRT